MSIEIDSIQEFDPIYSPSSLFDKPQPHYHEAIFSLSESSSRPTRSLSGSEVLNANHSPPNSKIEKAFSNSIGTEHIMLVGGRLSGSAQVEATIEFGGKEKPTSTVSVTATAQDKKSGAQLKVKSQQDSDGKVTVTCTAGCDSKDKSPKKGK